MNTEGNIDKNRLPQHVAVIMDGNGRWAKKKGNQRIFGHRNAIKAVRDTVEAAAELGINYLTLYAFSTENWNRPKSEVNALMHLLVATLNSEIETLMKNNVRLQAIGDMKSLPTNVYKQLQESISKTSANTGLTLALALSYSGRWEIIDAIKKLAHEVKDGHLDPEKIDESILTQTLQAGFMPAPELLIRTSGEYRISNFLLWHIAYSEFYFTDVLWPDFSKKHFYAAIEDFQKRERRFGKISEQLKPSNVK